MKWSFIMYKWFISFSMDGRLGNAIFLLDDGGLLSEKSLEFVEESLGCNHGAAAVVVNFIQIKS